MATVVKAACPAGVIRSGLFFIQGSRKSGVLTVVQFPITDFRPFLGEKQSRLLVPSWPPSTSYPSQFVHFFGRAIPRHLGVDRAWVDEQAFCCANRALRFPKLFQESNDWKGNFNCAFRRLLSDGKAVTRVEVGLSLFSTTAQNRLWRVFGDQRQRTQDEFDHQIWMSVDERSRFLNLNPLDVVRHALTIPTMVWDADNTWHSPLPSKPVELIRQGKPLADLYFHATIPHKQNADLIRKHDSLRYVAPGSPVVITECMDHWINQLPKDFIRIPKTETGGIQVAFGRLKLAWGAVDTWILGCNWAIPHAIRNLRLCLLRLHAEQQVLKIVLDRLKTGTIEYRAGEPSGDGIEAYLNESTKIIDRKRWGGIQQSAILEAFDAVGATEKDIERANLEERLRGMRLQVRRKIQRFERRAARIININDNASYVEEQIVEKSIIIGNNNTISAPVVIADTIEKSFQTLETSSAGSEIKDLLSTLLKQIAVTAKGVPEETATELADNAKTLSEEVSRAKPRRKWYELSIEDLRKAAEAVGEIGKPIIETTEKLLPLLVQLWP